MGKAKITSRRRIRVKSSKMRGPSLPNFDERELALHPFSFVDALRAVLESGSPSSNEGAKPSRSRRKSRKQKRR
jgi:hypothetical protein